MRTFVLTVFAALFLTACQPSQSDIDAQNKARDAELIQKAREMVAAQQQKYKDSSARFNTTYADEKK
ncbi:hypothetical protein Q8A64_16610 [Oxalobacteraceae bacterium R-40]|uniref:Lipoprotein n=1 Tax=Keguizhuia sedimenti TaxID=3064264 RepID=A0ABU1BUB9_9BURK|nr:hypothetical protein [Oxalobacteraceae bacterium R-40]